MVDSQVTVAPFISEPRGVIFFGIQVDDHLCVNTDLAYSIQNRFIAGVILYFLDLASI